MLPQKYEFDVVIPVHERDKPILEHCINGVRKNLIGVRRIITVSKEKYTQNAEWIDEAIFPFSYDLVKSYRDNKSTGWFFQQLLKMYSPIVIPDILPNEALDADKDPFYKIFLKNHGQGVASEYQIYFNFMMVFHPDLIVIRKLKFKNTSDPDITKYSIFPKYHFCSFHHYLRGTKQKSLRNKFRGYFYKIIQRLFVKNPVP
jgi:hypothetical protein